MDELLKKLLKALGVETVTDEMLNDAEKLKLIKVEDVVSEIVGNQKEILSSDADFIAPIRTAAIGEVLNARQQNAIKLGLITKEEVAALPEKDRFDAVLKLIAEKSKKAPANADDKDKEIERLNSLVLNKDEELRKIKEEEIPSIQTQFQKQLTEREINLAIRATFDKTLNGKLVADSELLYPGIESQLKSKYDIGYEGGVPVLLEKGKTTKAFKNSKPIQLADAFMEIAEEKKAVKKQEEKPARRIPEDDGKPKRFDTKGSTEFQKQLEAKKAQLEKP